MIIKKKQAPKQQIDRHVKVYRIPYSKNFRGFKRYHVTMHGVENAEANAAIFHDMDISGLPFDFVCHDTDYGSRIANLYINEKPVGAVTEDDRVKEIESGRIEMIHTEPDEEVIVTKSGDHIRKRIRFLVKYKEG